jgi:hypothetical protein
MHHAFSYLYMEQYFFSLSLELLILEKDVCRSLNLQSFQVLLQL